MILGSGKQQFRKFAREMRAFVATAMVAFLVLGCIENSPGSKNAASKSSGGSSSSGSSGTVTTPLETQCSIFKNNTNDYNVCLTCKQSLCPCTEYYPNSSTCKATNINVCSVNDTLLVACVHDNITSTGGACTGLKCGDNQVADFTNCACKDATPPTTIGPAPGHDDQSTPYMEPGFFISNRYCSAADTSTSISYPIAPVKHACLLSNAGTGSPVGFSGQAPIYTNQAPANVFNDVGYVRWDLALDASQYPSFLPLDQRLAYTGTTSTILGSMSMYYQLKPNTVLTENTVKFNDCVEHFSGSNSTAGGTGTNSTNNQCDLRTAIGSTNDAQWTPAAIDIAITTASSYSGTAKLEQVSLNGNSANANITNFAPNGNPGAKYSTVSNVSTKYGMGKLDVGRTFLNDGANFDFTRDETCVVGTGDGCGTGLISNVGYYKYTWGPLTVKRTNVVGDYATGSVTGRIAVNMNLGYTPASLAESSALSPEGILGRVTTRDCSTSAVPNPCVVTGVYRAPGGAVMSQSYSNRFTTSRQASSVASLPTGITAVSTPKIIEDTSQLAVEPVTGATYVPPARLRAFVRAADGNIYMSRFKNGSWNSWLSLGRPWICDPSGGGGSGALCDNATQPAAYRPFNSGAYADMPSVFDAGATIQPNNGLSIAGEPVVASYMDTSLGANNGTKGYIAVFVRVSHLKSTRGTAILPGGNGFTYGPYHNAVFYTVAAVATAAISNSATPYFDNISNWSQWMPVMDDDENIMRIQGNPTAFIVKKGTGAGAANEVRAYVLGTAAPGLHPPIAPSVARNTNGAASIAINAGWYNYGNSIVRSSLLLDSPIDNFENTSGVYASNVGSRTRWGDFQQTHLDGTVSSNNGFDAAIVSDWTWAPVDPTSASGTDLSNFTSIRIFATAYTTARMRSVAGETGVSPFSFTNRNIYYHEFTFANAATSRLTASCDGVYNVATAATAGPLDLVHSDSNAIYNYPGFFGSVFPINLGDHPRAGLSTMASPGAAGVATNAMFLFGRAVCPNKSCDVVNPSVGYMTVRSTSECAGATDDDFKVFLSGLSRTHDVTVPTVTNEASERLIQQAYSSSDVIPIHSKALDVASSDVPVYFIYRSPSGQISNGFWSSRQNATTGSKIFSLGTVGGLTN